MGILTDYFAATPEEALACLTDGPLRTDLPMAELKSVDPAVVLGRLWAAAEGAEFSVAQYAGDSGLVASVGDEGPFLVGVKEGCRAALAAIADDRIPALAEAWSRAPEWYGAEPDALALLIPMLRDVARAGGENGRSLYVRIVV